MLVSKVRAMLRCTFMGITFILLFPVNGIVYDGSSHLRSRWSPSLLLQSTVEMAMERKERDLRHKNIPHKSDNLHAISTLKKIFLKLFIASDVYIDWC
jgi:hypothetical protein